MVSSLHEAMHRIFREDPGLFARATRALDIPPFETPISATPLPTDLTENRPVERRVDTLMRIKAPSGEYLLAVEAQVEPDENKHNSWTYYMAHLYAKYKLPPVLLVVCKDQQTAKWAARPVRIGPPQWPSLTLHPLVLGPGNVPVIDTPEEAASDIPLTVLSAVLHGRDRNADAILKPLAAALKDLEARDPETATLFAELTSQGLDKTEAHKLWRQLVAVDTSFFTSSISQEIRTEGEVKGRVKDILLLLEGRNIPVSDTDRERVTTCDDLDFLDRWFRRAITANSTTEVFAEDSDGQETDQQ